jgi:hypothetical protein
MAETADSSNNTGIVAIVVVLVIVLIAGFFAWQNGMFGSRHNSDTKVNVQLSAPDNSPKPAENPAPADQPH